MTRDSRPLLARLLLRLFLRGRHREFIRGDIEEEYSERVLPTSGGRTARAWYWQQALRSVVATWSLQYRTSHRHRDKRLPGSAGMQTFWQDGRYAGRVMRSRPLLTATAILTIALGIGPTTAIFSVANWALYRPIPGLSEPDRLVWSWVGQPSPSGGTMISELSHPNHADLMDQITALDGFVGRQWASLQVGAEGATPVVRSAEFVMDGYLEVLGVRPVLGRDFTSQEMNSTEAYVSIISYGLWRNLLNQDPAVLGRKLVLNGRQFTIIGVTPKGFHGCDRNEPIDLWLPGGVYYYALHWDFDPFTQRGEGGFHEFVGRLAPGYTVEQAQAQLDAATANLATAYPEINEKFKDVRVTLFPEIGLHPMARDRIATTVRLLFYVVSLVLLIACANVANVLICRGVARRGEGAVRKALGASSWRLMRQHLTESGLLSLMGGALGLAIAVGATSLLDGTVIRGLGSLEGIRIDWRVLSFAVAVSVLSGIVFGIAPATFASRIDLATMLKDSSRSETGRRPYLRRGLAGLQLAVSLTLIVAAVLFIQTLHNLSHVDLGFDPRNVTAFAVSPGDHGYSAAESRRYYAELLRRIRLIPGVQHASVARLAPFRTGNYVTHVRAAGDDRDEAEIESLTNRISPDYFVTLQLSVKTGLTSAWQEDVVAAEGREKVVLLSETLAKRLFGDRDPVGRQVVFAQSCPDCEPYRVVGTVADTRWNSLTDDQAAMVYEPFGQDHAAVPFAEILVRSSIGEAAVAGAVRDAAKALDSSLPLARVEPLSESVGRELSQQRMFANLLTALAALAVLLAAVGLYGLVAYGVAERTHEFGIRRAIGAQSGSIVGLVLRQTAVVAGFGVALGIAGGIGAEFLIKAKLFGVAELNPLVYGTAVAILVPVALVASLVPARTATRVDPLVALRHE